MMVLYLTSQIGFSNNHAIIIYHVHCAILFFTGIFGAIISDTWLGKFRTILYMHLFSLSGMVLFLSTAAAQLQLPFR